jgi:hypothetical protein
VATIIPQPVPQKRQTALSQRHPPSDFGRLAASICFGKDIPMAVAAAATAVVFTKSLLFIPMILILVGKEETILLITMANYGLKLLKP